ncbi:hypothetical protein [Hufsiella ginkgonis]|uniref:VCBS repeat-containing protein n=1 Tax=Hufsiella ginkgonis TaxID=2695274 RepID=A0A7K1XZF9_9SPHI|nr:hypothetical protein [Hufsiella ginkgonis]MXV16119.1 hypothetical protein [Hufsiella ginkgonis]
MKKISFFIAAAAASLMASCAGDDKGKVVAEQVIKEPALTAPFRFHKAIEVKPGLTFDVLSWGRGSESSGSFLILRSDSTHLEYRSTEGKLDGRVEDAWNMDMDSDGNPEIFIQSKGEGEGSYLNLYVYEFNNSGSAQPLKFPELTAATRKLYRGMDSVYVKDGKLRRDFPLFGESDPAGKPSAGKKQVEYSLRNNTFTIKEVENDTTRSK